MQLGRLRKRFQESRRQNMLGHEKLEIQNLTTNNLFTEEECIDLKSLRETAIGDVAVLDAEIALAQLSLDSDTFPISTRQLSAIRKKRRNLVAFISACNIATAPQKCLPAELLSYIFALAFDGYSSYLPPAGRNTTPLALCHTCSRWRKIALNTLELWSNVVFRLSPGLDTYKTLEVVQEWFSRSGSSRPLSLETSCWPLPSDYNCDHEAIMQSILHRLIIPYSDRFSTLKLRLPEAEIYSLLTVSGLSFPLLKSLVVIRDSYVAKGWAWPSHGVENIVVFKYVPQLTSIELHEFQRRDHAIHTIFTWTKMTHISFQSTPLSVAQSHDIFRKCRRLLECRLSIDGLMQDDDPNPPPKLRIQLADLRVLEVSFVSPRTWGGGIDLVSPFFDPLHASSLKDLSVSNAGSIGHVNWPTNVLLNVFKSSGCDIETLSIHGVSLQEETVANIIHTLPSLSILSLGVDNLIPRPTLEGIARGDLLPNLKTLVCGIDHLETVIYMLEKRWEGSLKPNAPFARPAFFMLDYVGTRITRDQAVRVDRLRSKGIEIEMERVKENIN